MGQEVCYTLYVSIGPADHPVRLGVQSPRERREGGLEEHGQRYGEADGGDQGILQEEELAV